MANGVMNIAKGRANEFYRRVDGNDPTNSVMVLVLLKVAEADATLEDYDDLSALLGAAGNTEADFTNYARKTLTDTELASITVDDTGNTQYFTFVDQTWINAGGATNNTLVKLIVCYDNDSTGGTDANIVPISHHDFSATTNGNDLTADFGTKVFEAS